MSFDSGGVLRIAVASICGAAIGVEREWSGHATGPAARIGGVRTFTLLGALAGLAGWMWAIGFTALSTVLLAGGVGLVVVGYVAASRRDVDGTTEVAALVMLAVGALAGLGYLALASGVTAVTTLLLVEKSRLHSSIARLDDAEIRAAIRFAVMAAVILPLLPEGPYGPWGGVRPRELWLLVLFFSGISFAGFLARRAVGVKHGYPLAGLLGGIVSSTSVTFTFSRESREQPALSGPLAFGILGACTVMLLRIVVATAVLNQDLMTALLPFIAAPFLIGIVCIVLGWRRLDGGSDQIAEPSNPLDLRTALQMALLFQIVLLAVHAARERWGDLGLVVSGAIVGLTDLDALTISMAKSAAEPAAVAAASQAIAVGILANTLFKGAIAIALGRGAVRILLPLCLAGMAAALVGALFILR